MRKALPLWAALSVAGLVSGSVEASSIDTQFKSGIYVYGGLSHGFSAQLLPVAATGFSCAGTVVCEDFSALATQCAATPLAPTVGSNMTFVRATSATLEHPSGTIVATCGSDTLRVVSGFGYLAEYQQSNSFLRSEELNNASWAKTGATCAAPTVSADSTVAPDGTTTAETVTYPACSGSNKITVLKQAATSYLVSIYAKSSTPSAAIDVLAEGDDGVDFYLAATRNSVPSAWGRVYNATDSSGPPVAGMFGYDSVTGVLGPGGSASAIVAQTDIMWGAQSEGANTSMPALLPSSYIKTVGTTATRNTDVLTVGNNLSQNEGSFTIVVYLPFASSQMAQNAIVLDAPTVLRAELLTTGAYRLTVTSSTTASTAATAFAAGSHTLKARWKKSVETCVKLDNGAETCVAGPTTSNTAAPTLGYVSGAALHGYITSYKQCASNTSC